MSSGAVRRPARTSGAMQGFAVGRAVRGHRGEKIDAGMAREGVGDGQPLRLGERVGLAAAEGEARRAGPLGGKRQQRGAIAHQALIGLAGPIPFEHGEFGMVQGAALAVAIDRARS